eukprot:g2677.t1
MSKRVSPEATATNVVGKSSLHVALAATFTVDECVPGLEAAAKRAGFGSVDISLGLFNNVIQSLLDLGSLFYSPVEAAGVNVALIRPSDMSSGDAMDDVVKALRKYNEEASASRPLVVMIAPDAAAVSPVWETLVEAVSSCSKIIVVPTSEVARCCNGWQEDLFDAEADKLGAMPYTVEGYRRLSAVIIRVIHYLLRPPTKVIAVDCDNTLWQGIVGDAGGATSVKANLPLMTLLAKLSKENGMLLVTFSKNEEEDVKAAFEAHPSWPLSFTDSFVCHYINWESKAANLQACAERLNLGLESFVFIDDNPVEIGLVQAQLPQIGMLMHVPNTTDATKEEIEAWANCAWPLDAFRRALEEDKVKTLQYKAEAERKAASESAASMAGAAEDATTTTASFADFIATLNLEIEISKCSSADEARCLQLSQKSNQFNFTTKRLTVMPGPPMQCHLCRVRDKYGDYGLVGVLFFSIVGDKLILDNLLMSCRVLGRGVEHRMIAALGDVALKAGVNFVELAFARSERNQPAEKFLQIVNLLPTGSAEADIGSVMSQEFPAAAVAGCKFDPERVSYYGAKPSSKVTPSAVNADFCAIADFSAIAREDAKRLTSKKQDTESAVDSFSIREACIEALRIVLGDDAANAVVEDGDASIYSLGLDSLSQVRITSHLRKNGLGKDVTPTDLQRAATLNQWITLLSGNTSRNNDKHSECMFKVKGKSGGGKAPLVFIHPAGGAIGPFNKIFRALDDEREVWAVEHPFFVNENFNPREKTLADTGKVYADAIISKLGLRDVPGEPGTSDKKWIMVTYSAGGLWTNEAFHQLRMRKNAPHLVVLLDAGWGLSTGPLGASGRQLEEPNPVPAIMSREPLEEKTTTAASARIRQYIDETYGEEGQGEKFQRMVEVYIHGTFRSLTNVKVVPWAETPLAVYQAKRPMMRTLESVYQTRDFNVVDHDKFVVNLKDSRYQNIFKKDPPGNRAHQLFTSDDAVVEKICKRLKALLHKMYL